MGLGGNNYCSIPILADKSLNVDYSVEGIALVFNNLKYKRYILADEDCGNCRDDLVKINILLGTDSLCHLRQFTFINCLNGKAIKTEFGVIPFGPVISFLTPNQIDDKFKPDRRIELNHSTKNRNRNRNRKANKLKNQETETGSMIINTILNPVSTYFDPLMYTHTETDLDLGIESLYKLESMGIKDTNMGSIDEILIKQFEDSIEYRDNKYYVALPWYKELISKVPSNHSIALATLKRVVQDLKNKNLLETYGNVFKEQHKEGILEEIFVKPSEYKNYIWITHRPVIKETPQIKTKIRPVLNCSLKIGDCPSLNEASYPGINILGSLFKLLCLFRSNQYVLIGDIQKAFLQIRLKLEEDRNRFCIFWQDGDQLRTFRYASICFGLSASSFILNYIIKHHANKYAEDLCTQLLKSRFYVDDFIHTSSSIKELKEVYHESITRLQEGGFRICSFNTNNQELLKMIQEDKRESSHDCQEERVLGYLYNPERDTLKLNDFELSSVKTKRELLSNISKIFY